MEKIYKEKMVEVVKNMMQGDKNFLTDWNTIDEKLKSKVEDFLKNFIESDSKHYEINMFFVQGKKYYSLDLKEYNKIIYTFDINKNMLLELI